jgi:hypothetical protein
LHNLRHSFQSCFCFVFDFHLSSAQLSIYLSLDEPVFLTDLYFMGGRGVFWDLHEYTYTKNTHIHTPTHQYVHIYSHFYSTRCTRAESSMKSTFSDPGPLLIGSVGGSGNSGVMGELKMLLHMHQVTHTHKHTQIS